MFFAARQRLVGECLQPCLVRGRTVLGTRWVGVEQLDDFSEARPGLDARARRGDLGAEVVEVGPRPLVHLLRIEVGAQHRAHTNSVTLGPAAIGFVGVGRVVVAQIRGEVAVRGVGIAGTIANLVLQRGG